VTDLSIIGHKPQRHPLYKPLPGQMTGRPVKGQRARLYTLAPAPPEKHARPQTGRPVKATCTMYTKPQRRPPSEARTLTWRSTLVFQATAQQHCKLEYLYNENNVETSIPSISTLAKNTSTMRPWLDCSDLQSLLPFYTSRHPSSNFTMRTMSKPPSTSSKAPLQRTQTQQRNRGWNARHS